MKRLLSVVLASLITAQAPAARMGGGVTRGSSGGRGSAAGIHAAPMGGGHVFAGPSGRAMGSVARNGAVSTSIVRSQGVERAPNRFFFHDDGGVRFWHFVDRDRFHWFGFPFGPSFFWFPFFAGYWWWWDPAFGRWDFWYGDNWWWYGPGGATFVYVNDSYVPYDQYTETDASGATPPSAPPTAPPKSAAANQPTQPGGTWKTPDGRRLVQISGSANGAFLFDNSKTPPALIKHLGDGAEQVRFSGAGPKTAAKILVDYQDGTFVLYDEDGNPS